MGFFNRRDTIRFIQENGGMYELHSHLVDLFLDNSFHLREVRKDRLYIHYGTDDGKIGITIIQISVDKIEIYVMEELPFKRTNSFKIETITNFPTFQVYEKILSSLRLVNYEEMLDRKDRINILTEEANDHYHNFNYSEALKIYQEITELSGENVMLILQKAGCYKEMGDFKTALSLCNKAESIDANDSMVYLVKGGLFLAKNEFSLAIDEFEKGKDLGDSNCLTHYNNLRKEISN